MPGLSLKGTKQGWEELLWLWHSPAHPASRCHPGARGDRQCREQALLGDSASHLLELAGDARRGLAALLCPLSLADGTCWDCGTAGAAPVRRPHCQRAGGSVVDCTLPTLCRAAGAWWGGLGGGWRPSCAVSPPGDTELAVALPAGSGCPSCHAMADFIGVSHVSISQRGMKMP